MTRLLERTRSQSGLSLVELLLVVAIMGIVGAMGTAQIATVRRSMQGDGAMRLVMSQMTTAREMAVTQRRNMEVRFVGGVGGNWLQIVRREVPAGLTTLSSVAFEGSVTYRIISTIPSDTPDQFGKGSALTFTGTGPYLFSTDGTLIDNLGNPANGTIFLAIANVARSQRAVTIMGGTGRVRGYKWNGFGWTRV